MSQKQFFTEARLPINGLHMAGEPSFEATQEVRHAGRIIVCFQARAPLEEDGKPYVIVPGFMVGKWTRNRRGLRRVRVKPVPEKEQVQISRLLRRRRLQGPIDYW